MAPVDERRKNAIAIGAVRPQAKYLVTPPSQPIVPTNLSSGEKRAKRNGFSGLLIAARAIPAAPDSLRN
jgi:hypothetical protein